MIIRIPKKCSKELRKGRFIISRLGSLSHRVVALQKRSLSHRGCRVGLKLAPTSSHFL
jgi:transposase